MTRYLFLAVMLLGGVARGEDKYLMIYPCDETIHNCKKYEWRGYGFSTMKSLEDGLSFYGNFPKKIIVVDLENGVVGDFSKEPTIRWREKP